MPLKTRMTTDEIVGYLKGDLLKSIRNDVDPILRHGPKTGGFFAVTRLVLCYVDYLGALANGWPHGCNFERWRHRDTTTPAIAFLANYFPENDSPYKKRPRLIYNIYRHGTVHLYAPKVVRRGKRGKRLGWLVYRGRRKARTKVGGTYINVTHLEPIKNPVPSRKNVDFLLPVSINALRDDLVQGIKNYSKAIWQGRNASDLRRKFRQVARMLLRSEPVKGISRRWELS